MKRFFFSFDWLSSRSSCTNQLAKASRVIFQPLAPPVPVPPKGQTVSPVAEEIPDRCHRYAKAVPRKSAFICTHYLFTLRWCRRSRNSGGEYQGPMNTQVTAGVAGKYAGPLMADAAPADLT